MDACEFCQSYHLVVTRENVSCQNCSRLQLNAPFYGSPPGLSSEPSWQFDQSTGLELTRSFCDHTLKNASLVPEIYHRGISIKEKYKLKMNLCVKGLKKWTTLRM